MRILYLTEEPITFSGTMVRGGQIHVRNVIEGLCEKGHDVYLLDWNDTPEKAYQRSLSPEIRYVVDPSRTTVRAVSVGREVGIDIVVSKTRKTYLPGLVAARTLDVPHVVHVGSYPESSDDGVSGMIDTLSARTRLRAPHDGYFVVCEALRDELVRLGVGPKQIHDVKNAVDTDRFHPEDVPTPLDPEYEDRIEGFDDGQFILGFVGGIHSYKGLGDLATAMDHINVNCGVVIAGDGPDHDHLGRRFGDDGLLLGSVPYDQVPALYHRFDAFVLPSHTEGLPRVVLEAQATGTPVIATSVGGVPEVVANGTTGLLCEPRSPRELAVAVEKLIHSPSVRKELAQAGRERVAESYSWSQMYERYEQYLRRVASC